MSEERGTEVDAAAALESVTVQAAVALAASEDGEHCNAVTVTGATRDKLADVDDPLKEAVMVAV